MINYVKDGEGPTLNKPNNPNIGFQYWNTELNCLEIWDGNAWNKIYSVLVFKANPYSIKEGSTLNIPIKVPCIVKMGDNDITNTISDEMLVINSVTGNIVISLAIQE